MQTTYESWLATQDPARIAVGMGLPPLSDAGCDVLGMGHEIGRFAAESAATLQEARSLIRTAVEGALLVRLDEARDAMATAVGLARSTWLHPVQVFENASPGGALLPFLERVAYRTAVTRFALTAQDCAPITPILSEDTIGMMQVAMPTPPPTGVEVSVGDIFAHPRGRHSLEGSLVINGQSVRWLYAAPFSVCTTPQAKLARIMGAGNDATLAVSMAEWVNTQIDLIAHGAAAQVDLLATRSVAQFA